MSRAFGAFSLIVKIQNASSKMRLKARTKLESLKLELLCIPQTENQSIQGKKDCDYGFTGVCVSTNPSNYIHKICPFFLYTKYILIKLLRKRNFRRQVQFMVFTLENMEIQEIDKKFISSICLGFIIMIFSLAFVGRKKISRSKRKKKLSFKVQYN